MNIGAMPLSLAWLVLGVAVFCVARGEAESLVAAVYGLGCFVMAAAYIVRSKP